MSIERLRDIAARIEPLDEEWIRRARSRLDSLTKPQGSLGELEAIAARMAGIHRTLQPPVSPKAVIVMAADHGVCEEGVSAYPQAVTEQMVRNFLAGGAAVNVLARSAGADVVCVDMGVIADIGHPGLSVLKPARGTANMTKGPAMSVEEALRAIEAGIRTVGDWAEKGYRLFAVGEMGIGNTTAAAALLTALTGVEPGGLVGRGTGVDDAGLARKRGAVARALEANRPDRGDAFDALRKVGGLEIAGMVGVYLGAGLLRVPVIADGYISTVAALVAARIAPAAGQYIIPSHLSEEPGHALALRELGLSPLLSLNMRLGEGTGAVLCMSLVEAAVRLMNEMATFDSAGVSGKDG
ncbi:nicotinate-nucleotide--dimethylbenzimidazole phosphoribosyltransferase [Paenibacillus thermotolerans]|uniref:nicotinate-nucleotide--dimethylbenzimidazole phosphoribosyltransferase n=1 Tax=Paenibacillus thermotolerans TaxID=3027807 RepID=UPI0023682FEA|nr:MULTISPECIES: nicotinate-nucleotide--dimethylbenzimidazole phosphoribosyltransferase [unclassified Paenibacillus]